MGVGRVRVVLGMMIFDGGWLGGVFAQDVESWVTLRCLFERDREQIIALCTTQRWHSALVLAV